MYLLGAAARQESEMYTRSYRKRHPVVVARTPGHQEGMVPLALGYLRAHQGQPPFKAAGAHQPFNSDQHAAPGHGRERHPVAG
jgi:hypothetical protein